MKTNYLLAAAFVTALTFSSCKEENKVPKDPKDGQEYKDENNNRWVWNSPMGAWLIYSALGGGNHYYYPATNRWTDAQGSTLAGKPSFVSTTTVDKVQQSYKANSTVSKQTTKTTPAKKGVFGKTGRSHSTFS